jgi:uncharacterized protein YcsI (UPF0317 family)
MGHPAEVLCWNVLDCQVTHSPGYMMICDLLEEELMVEQAGAVPA